MQLPISLRLTQPLLIVALLAASAPRTLREAANSSGFLIGTAVRPSLLQEPAYSATLAREFNMVEPEDALKWSVVRRDQNYFDFRQADDIVHFAHAHGMKVRGHCLVWNHDNPAWLQNGNFTPRQLSEFLHEHIVRMMHTYSGQVFAWDVVNEALDENGKVRDSIWYNKPGIGLADRDTAYIEQAFRWAHDADQGALLFYNDNGAEGLGVKSDAVYAMLKDFKARHVPIDGVGLQMHISDLDYDTEKVAANIARLTKLGLQVHITELDVSLPVDANGQPGDRDLQRQAQIYVDIARACLQNPGCTAIQTWGFTDKYSWIGSHSHGTRGAALLFDRGYKLKPAYNSVLQALSSGRQTSH